MRNRQWERGKDGGEYTQTTFYAGMKGHNETHLKIFGREQALMPIVLATSMGGGARRMYFKKKIT
jgi:hypothetical protein